MNKRVPMIRPLYEVVTPSSAAAAATSTNNFLNSASDNAAPTPATTNKLRQTANMLPPLRKSKRLRSPFLDNPAEGEPESKKVKEDASVSLCSPNSETAQPNGSASHVESGTANAKTVNGPNVSSSDVKATANGVHANTPAGHLDAQSREQPAQATPASSSKPKPTKSAATSKAVVAPSGSKAVPAASEEAYSKVTAICEQERIMWAKVKGHPFWPTQVVRMDINLASQERFKTAARFRRKGDDTCLMYFGTCEVAWINASKATISWAEGLEKGFHKVLKARPKYQLALNQVLRYCAQKTEYPRGWWCEPICFSLSYEFTDICRSVYAEAVLKPFSATAERERVCWGKMKGYPYWPVQVLPFSVVYTSYPELKLKPLAKGASPSSWPCMFFGTGEVAMIADRSIAPFITGVRKKYWAASDRQPFTISLGEMWGYLQKDRIWPSGYSSGRLWWNHGSTDKEALEACNQPGVPNFIRLKNSVYAPGVPKPSQTGIEEAPKCTCQPATVGCSDSSCLNVASRFWCDADCSAGKSCVNRPFSMRPAPKVSPFYTTNQRGWGLRLDESVRKGDYIISYVGEILDRTTLSKRLDQKNNNGHTEYYIMETNDEYFIDAEHRGNLARFINSSCAPNCESQKWTDPATGQTHVGIFALKDIVRGTEVTYNYREEFGFGFDETKIRSFVCRCRADTCCMMEPAEREHVVRCVGKRIRVRWDDGWYLGRVDSYSQERKRFRVLYDDGDDEELTLGLPTLPKNGDGVSFKLLDENDQELKNGV